MRTRDLLMHGSTGFVQGAQADGDLGSPVPGVRVSSVNMTRYALYYTPANDSPWAQAGSSWLGRHHASPEAVEQVQIPGIPRLLLASLTADARRYGFHATLKAPFRLFEGFTEEHLLQMARAFCTTQKAIVLEEVRVRPLMDFLALQVNGPLDEIGGLAMRCVTYFDLLRAPLTEPELAKRRQAGLTARQSTLLQRWGYPYTEEFFRFHMTLTDALMHADADVIYTIRKAAEQHFAVAAASAPLTIDALTIAREEHPGAPFVEWQRIPFSAQSERASLPISGRIFFCVGPSGVGKDSLLNWVREQCANDEQLVFAQRTITRATQGNEEHEAVDTPTFWRLAASGQFAMVWQANDLCYGVRRGIEADLKAGRDVVINGSRAYVPQLLQAFPDAIVVWIEANENILRERLEARQREEGPALLKRLKRAKEFVPSTQGQVIRLDNSGPLDVAGHKLLDILRERK
ncbi:MAG: phosphonate metabolism protein/1,5-bisphosphokinase (PRPP-forming) PhnN [Burkholderiaceae bacterium]|uniref:Ribose 1,5-bisphosphate phosphokinase PhnN n=1 Tax=Herminiimonas contaminans TaxID=1111140 RepID=A0ABS0ET82_9BURK|nr:phosphonate metabolism protein/1,5-bisphosphokinase (PRPP-forming) PhnN [Herminiimonas contaminans]MBF8178058.1 phosphonate metabolism protein/1,5-bisphosphokinase (PRPP-forming) PhnN [Herminiimonas contaminans]MBX9798124.1 phosphonate metabolism protein/1,5-bisphosphokinase (PRPP-forming) PhnN [Burkholderiaceae bacterium]